MGSLPFENLKEIVSADPSTLGGKAVFKGTHVTVEEFFAHLEKGAGLGEFLRTNPDVTHEQAVAALESSKEWIEANAPISTPRKSLLGCMEGSIVILGDIVAPIDVEWDAMK